MTQSDNMSDATAAFSYAYAAMDQVTTPPLAVRHRWRRNSRVWQIADLEAGPVWKLVVWKPVIWKLVVWKPVIWKLVVWKPVVWKQLWNQWNQLEPAWNQLWNQL